MERRLRYIIVLCMMMFCSAQFTAASQSQSFDGERPNKVWTIHLSGLAGQLKNGDYRLSDHTEILPQTACAFMPSVEYHLSSKWSTGISVLLPIPSSNNKKLSPQSYTTGGGLFLRRYIKVLPKLQLSFDLILSGGMIGSYQYATDYITPYCIRSDNNGRVNETCSFEGNSYQHYRWQIGVSPNLTYQITPRWGIEMSYGLLGYFSNKDLEQTYTDEAVGYKPKGGFGFSAEVGRGTALRLGLTYSF